MPKIGIADQAAQLPAVAVPKAQDAAEASGRAVWRYVADHYFIESPVHQSPVMDQGIRRSIG